MKRYEITDRWGEPGSGVEAEKPDGSWVLYSDHVAALAAAEAERDEARDDADELRDGLQRSCDAIDAFGFRSDDYGGPHLSDCIKKLGNDLATTRAAVARLERERDELKADGYQRARLEAELATTKAALAAAEARADEYESVLACMADAINTYSREENVEEVGSRDVYTLRLRDALDRMVWGLRKQERWRTEQALATARAEAERYRASLERIAANGCSRIPRLAHQTCISIGGPEEYWCSQCIARAALGEKG